jgi:signal transduction histidine kinase
LRAIAHDGEQLASLRNINFRSFVSAPIQVRGATFGAITFLSSRSGRRLGVDDLALVEDLAQQASLAIENTHLYQAELQARRAIERLADRTGRLYKITAALSRALTPASVADVIVEQGHAALGARACLIALLTADGTEMEVVGSVGYPAGQIDRWRRFPLRSEVPLSDAVRTREVILAESPERLVERYPRFAAPLLRSQYKAWVAVPLLVEDRVLGAMGLSFGEARTFSEDDRGFMLALARQCAQALERARLYDAERTARSAAEAARRTLEFLAEASTILAGSLDYEETLNRVARLVTERLADWCIVHVLDEKQNVRRVAVAHADPAKVEMVRELDRRVPPQADQSFGLAQVLRSGQTDFAPEITDAILSEALRDPEHRAFVRELGITSYMTVPLKAQGRVFGAISFVNTGSDRRYGPEDVRLAEDLASRAALAIENARLYEEARQAVRIREDVLEIASHDLKNPLSAILLNAFLLTPPDGAEGGQGTLKYVQAIRRSAEQMNRLIHDLLDMARIEGGRFTIEPAFQDCRTLVDEALEMLQPLAKQKSIELRKHVSGCPSRVECDRERVLQVFSNIIGNAIRFTPKGGTIDVSVDAEPGAVRFTIRDTGPGIPEADLPHIYDRYWQSGETKRKGGLGLFIAREIVKAHGGRLWAESVPGEGATFYFTLPATVPAGTSGADEAASSRSS